jgi:hypothetical protein
MLILFASKGPAQTTAFSSFRERRLRHRHSPQSWLS